MWEDAGKDFPGSPLPGWRDLDDGAEEKGGESLLRAVFLRGTGQNRDARKAGPETVAPTGSGHGGHRRGAHRPSPPLRPRRGRRSRQGEPKTAACTPCPREPAGRSNTQAAHVKGSVRVG